MPSCPVKPAAMDFSNLDKSEGKGWGLDKTKYPSSLGNPDYSHHWVGQACFAAIPT